MGVSNNRASKIEENCQNRKYMYSYPQLKEKILKLKTGGQVDQKIGKNIQDLNNSVK